jgi:hypothetical protein
VNHIANYIHFSEEQKLRAGAVDLEEFLRLRRRTAHQVRQGQAARK